MKRLTLLLAAFAMFSANAQNLNPFGHALIPDLVADPSITVFDGTFYCYATTDGYGHGLAKSGPSVVWKSKDFVHWSFDDSERYYPSAYGHKFWAPSKCIFSDGKYYIYPTINERMYALVGDSPEGPFRLVKGEDKFRLPSVPESALIPGAGGGIDAEYFVDDDGSKYIYWNQRNAAKLLPDMATIDTTTCTVIKTGTGGYSEGPIFFKRNGIYYYVYTASACDSYSYHYVYGTESPLGPFKVPACDTITFTDEKEGVYGPGHGSIFEFNGQYYFAYLEYGRQGTTRQIYVNKLNFNDDGTIQRVKVDMNGVGALQPLKYGTPIAIQSLKASSEREPYEIDYTNVKTFKRTEYYVAQLAADGSNGSRWWAAKEDTTAWIIADLGKSQKIGRSEIAFVLPTNGHAYTLEGSNDGENWEACGGHEDVKAQSPHKDQIGKKFRYLRVKFLKGYCGIWEWNLYK